MFFGRWSQSLGTCTCAVYLQPLTRCPGDPTTECGPVTNVYMLNDTARDRLLTGAHSIIARVPPISAQALRTVPINITHRVCLSQNHSFCKISCANVGMNVGMSNPFNLFLFSNHPSLAKMRCLIWPPSVHLLLLDGHAAQSKMDCAASIFH